MAATTGSLRGWIEVDAPRARELLDAHVPVLPDFGKSTRFGKDLTSDSET